MDLSSEPFLECIYHCMRVLLHATEEGVWQLEAVSTLHFDKPSANIVRKLAAIDFFGVVLALAGSALLVVRSLHPASSHHTNCSSWRLPGLAVSTHGALRTS